MFKIYDGREQFYQWDKDRKLIVEDASIKEVHFCNRTDECSLVVDTYEENGLTLANVPNILLTTNWKINVYGFTGDYTKHSTIFSVVGRTKPTDYAYTETEVKSVEAIVDEAIQNVIENGDITIDVDLSEYATKNELEEYITETELEGKGYQTASEVETAINTALEGFSGGGGGEVYILDATTTAPTADEKAFLQSYIKYYKENGTFKPVDIYYKTLYPSINTPVYQRVVYVEMRPQLAYFYFINKRDGKWMGYMYRFNTSTYAITSANKYTDTLAKDWRWIEKWDDNGVALVSGGNFSQLKLVGYWDDNSTNIITYTISTSNGNEFMNEMGTDYQVAEPRATDGIMRFFLTYDYVDEDYTQEELFIKSYENNFTLLGAYYWG